MRMMIVLIGFVLIGPANAYELKNLSTADILTIGRGLDKLPREDTDKDSLYMRLQQQISEQNAEAAKASEDAMRKKFEGEKAAPPSEGAK
jgi:hypothetical protein